MQKILQMSAIEVFYIHNYLHSPLTYHLVVKGQALMHGIRPSLASSTNLQPLSQVPSPCLHNTGSYNYLFMLDVPYGDFHSPSELQFPKRRVFLAGYGEDSTLMKGT